MKKTLVVVAALATLYIGFQSCKKSSNNSSNVINVSGLLSLTGNWSTLGLNSQAAMQLAASDINAYLKNKNAGFTLSVDFYDTKLDPNLCKQYFATATDKGTHFIIGPQSSAELSGLVSAADSAQAIVISQGSTAGSLAIADDPVYRFCPPDKVEGAAIANKIYNDGIQGLVTLARTDAGNLGLQSSTGIAFQAKGGRVNALGAYSTALTDFTTQVNSLSASVSQFAGLYGNAHTAVYLASFDEGATLMAQAAGDPVLSSVKWYGGDGIALSAIMLANTAADQFAIQTSFIAPSFGLPDSLQSRWQPLAARIKAITNIDPDAFALASYDAMWVIANTLMATHGSTADFGQLKTNFVQQSNAYSGVTGPTALDSYGDRKAGAFDYWGITTNSGAYQWTVMGKSE